ncbi:MAG: glycosyltransferase family 4 protein [Micromonosporaceae bacterium]
MHVLFAWRRPSPPIFIGGAEVSQRLLAEALVQEGYRVTYIGGYEHSRTGRSERRQLLDRLAQFGIKPRNEPDCLRYAWRGVACLALPQCGIATALNDVIANDPPDLVISSQEGSGDLLRLVPEHVTTVGWLHSITDVGLDALRASPRFALATSRFVASRCRAPAGTRVVTFYPPFAPPTEPVNEPDVTRRTILMVNPVPEKGSDVVHQLAAAMPDRPFTLVEGWRPPDRIADLSNITHLPPQLSMDRLYRGARLLLVPSLVEEAFGRVVIEAGLHAVPAITSNLGGLPEAVAAGGMTLDPRDVDAWRTAIRDLDNAPAYTRYSDAARRNAETHLRRRFVDDVTVLGIR